MSTLPGQADRPATALGLTRDRPVGVLVVCPVRIYREELASALLRYPGIAVVGTAADSNCSPSRLEPQPDVILVDTSTAEGIKAATRLGQRWPSTRLVALAAPDGEDDVVACAAAGVVGYVGSDGSLDDVVATTLTVAAGGAAAASPIITALLQRVRSGDRRMPDEPEDVGLTPRERQILQLIDDGLSNREIAQRLYVELCTVKNHVHNILTKLGARRRTEAAARMRSR